MSNYKDITLSELQNFKDYIQKIQKLSKTKNDGAHKNSKKLNVKVNELVEEIDELMLYLEDDNKFLKLIQRINSIKC